MKQRNNKKNYQLRNTFEPPIFLNSSPCFFLDQDGKDIQYIQNFTDALALQRKMR